MKGILFLIYYSFLIIFSSFGQSDTWTWISGSNQVADTGVFGTQGIPSVNNHPPGLYEAAEWKDKQGTFWLYGGVGSTSASDLWMFDPVAKEWTWVKGNRGTNVLPIFGQQGVPNPSNTPGQRQFGALTWVDTSGHLWLFGGIRFSGDLWEYDINTNQWTWMKGDTMPNSKGVHGIQGMPALANSPGGRCETSSAWTDSLNNLWLFGGFGVDQNGYSGWLNDLWKYNINTNEWTWMKGSALRNRLTSYGAKGVSNAGNDPGGHWSYTKWKDVKGNFWIMGGIERLDTLTAIYYSNDVWKYDVSANEWTWMSGTDIPNDSGKYHVNCMFDTVNLPYSRCEQRSSITDNCGRFWLFGGVNLLINANGFLNDLWVFDSQQLKWNWISGSGAANQPGNYGILNVTSPSNMPPSRDGAVAWWGNDNKFYMFGGEGNSNLFSDVWVFNPDTNCIPFCNSVNVLPPVANFQSSKSTICANDCISFTDLSANATSWQWSFAGAADSISVVQNPQSICYQKAGRYNVTLIASNSGGGDSVTFTNSVVVIASPPTPGITQHFDTLYCSADSSYSTYQWLKDSTLISGATDTFLIIVTGGNYNVQVTNADGCKIAVGINIVLGLQNYANANDNVISLSPNPATSKLFVSGYKLTGSEVLTIYNVLGEVVQRSPLLRRGAGGEADVSLLPSGIYFVQLIGEKERRVGKFIKE